MQDRYRFFLSVALVCLAVPAVGSEITFIHPDHLGSPVAYTDINGNTIGREYYTPYGEPLNAPGNDGINFTGHVRDSNTGLLYMQARYYDPEIGRFLSVDPVTFSPAQTNHFNRYWYANGNPLRFTDPDGRESACLYVSGCSPAQAPTATEIAVAEAVIDFTPGVGDVKGIAEAVADPSAVNITAAAVGIIPGAGDAVGKTLKTTEKLTEGGAEAATTASKAFSSEKSALVDMAKMDKKAGGVTQGDMDAYKELNSGLADPFPDRAVRGLEVHDAGKTAGQFHGHVGPVNHIPEKKVE